MDIGQMSVTQPGVLKDEIHNENVAKLASMSEQEILAEQEKLLTMLGIAQYYVFITIIPNPVSDLNETIHPLHNH